MVAGADGDTLGISIHAPREGSDRVNHQAPAVHSLFLSTLPARGATHSSGAWRWPPRNFYPRSPRGERPSGRTSTARWANFYPRSPRGERPLTAPLDTHVELVFLSTLPARGATGGSSSNLICAGLFLSTLPARGATVTPRVSIFGKIISIHAPREGSDAGSELLSALGGMISIHAPREGSDTALPSTTPPPSYFYPRSPRGERPGRSASPRPPSRYFYPRSPRGERHGPAQGGVVAPAISIHAPREGSDSTVGGAPLSAIKFLSTLPARGATQHLAADQRVLHISIHAPREGSDQFSQHIRGILGISIHAPREGSDAKTKALTALTNISIHAPREGSDSRTTCPAVERHNFYPRSPRGERPAAWAARSTCCIFLSTLPARGATILIRCWLLSYTYFYPRSPRGERRGFD